MSTTSIPVPVGKETSILTVLSVSEVAEYLGVGKNRVYELLNTGKLNGFRMGSTWKISRMALENYILNIIEVLILQWEEIREIIEDVKIFM